MHVDLQLYYTRIILYIPILLTLYINYIIHAILSFVFRLSKYLHIITHKISATGILNIYDIVIPYF